MKAIKLEKPWDVACVEMEKPVPKAGEALIRIVTAGICGSDIGAFRGTNGLVSYPRVIGHELAAESADVAAANAGGDDPDESLARLWHGFFHRYTGDVPGFLQFDGFHDAAS